MALARLFGPQSASAPEPESEPKPPGRTCAECGDKLPNLNPENVCFRHESWGRSKGRRNRVHER
jgi:hypothetical protein